jgi:hypothetical protein
VTEPDWSQWKIAAVNKFVSESEWWAYYARSDEGVLPYLVEVSNGDESRYHYLSKGDWVRHHISVRAYPDGSFGRVVECTKDPPGVGMETKGQLRVRAAAAVEKGWINIKVKLATRDDPEPLHMSLWATDPESPIGAVWAHGDGEHIVCFTPTEVVDWLDKISWDEDPLTT